ncbi:MAG: T9SS type A sorting domain-containing protein [Bacteroidales bacterium]|nr:T9SS type A sorting domain-containing protein [Bacteroidales bacterium]
MKKYLFPLVMLSALLPCTAQDTVKWDDPWYLFNQKPIHAWEPILSGFIDCSSEYSDSSQLDSGVKFIFSQEYAIAKSFSVYGVAATACYGMGQPPIAYLYEKDENGVKTLIDSVVYSVISAKDCNFLYESYYHFFDNNYEHPLPTPRLKIVPCMEFYFDTPKNVDNTIIVEILMDNTNVTTMYGNGVMYSVIDQSFESSVNGLFFDLMGNCYETMANNHDRHGVIFPIVELRCRGEVPVAQVEEKGNGWAIVSWSPDYVEEDYMVGVGRYGTEPADSLTFMVPRGDTSFTITGLENGYPYGVWVKRGCRYAPGGYDTVVWGEWGRYASLYLPPDTTGILAADESGELKVYPNPAHGVLTVDLSEVNDAVAELTLSDLGGREVLRTKAERPLTKVDVSALPAGLYLLQAASPGKVYRRRVAVE